MMNEEEKLFDTFISSYLYSLKYLQEFISAPAADYGISFDQFLIMHEIWQTTDPITLMDVANLHRVSRSAISRQVGGLLDKKYVIQKTDDKDRRRKILKLTKEGSRIQKLLFDIGLKRAHSWMNVFGIDRLEKVLEFIHEFTQEVAVKEETSIAYRNER
jgi:DNA-binding MarR family transcriptional regulator